MTAIPGLSGAVGFLKVSFQVMSRLPTLTVDLVLSFLFFKKRFLFL